MFDIIIKAIAGFLHLPPEVIRNGIVIIFLGMIINAVVKNFPLLIKYISSFFYKKDIRAGKRHFYHYSRDNNGKIFFCRQVITIKRSFKRGYSVSIFETDNANDPRYKGSLDIEDSNFVIQLHSTFHSSEKKDKETISIRVKKIYGNGNQDMPGLYLGVSFGSRMYTTTCLITKEENITEESFNERIKKCISFSKNEYFLFER